ncbi:MAG: transglutaminase domain-containing protein [Clostridia bacterium]|nr:transglutaminase domain-containing protein [Clostridia bacterium]
MNRKVCRYISYIAVIALLLSALCLLSGCAEKMTIEAGQRVTPEDLTGDETATFGADFDPDCINHAGTHTFSVISGGKTVKVKLTVKDTVAPTMQVQRVYWAVGTKIPDPKYFVQSTTEVDTYTGEYVGTLPNFDSYIDYTVQVQYTDASGNKSPVYDVVLTPCKDEVPPTVDAQDVTCNVGEGIIWRNHVTLSDNCAGEVKLDVDSSKVNVNREGSYTVYYTATDLSGNVAKAEATVLVMTMTVTDEMLYTEIDKVISRIITKDMNKIEQCRAIYQYVQGNIAYVNTSTKGDWKYAAYMALFSSGTGDCYSYFAASKAFFERLGIENMDIQRLPGYTDNTHFWSLVNVGTSEEPVWYHYDSTRLTAAYNVSGCLLTDAQVTAYDAWRAGDYFRIYDKTAYPATSTKIVTDIPELYPYLK